MKNKLKNRVDTNTFDFFIIYFLVKVIEIHVDNGVNPI